MNSEIMKLIDITKNNPKIEIKFLSELKSNKLNDELSKEFKTFVFYYADWCPHSRKQLKKITNNSFIDLFQESKIIFINVDLLTDHAIEAGILVLPTLKIYNKANLLTELTGQFSEDEIASSIS